MDEFLGIASRHNLSTMLCLFDDCTFAGDQPYLGKQADPVPGVHNSGWTPCPGHPRVVDRQAWPMLEKYITSVVSRFANDPRVLAWDLYNEPGNAGMADKSIPLVERAFAWARSAQPQQPLTAGVWTDSMPALNDAMLSLSDIVSFHSYGDVVELEQQIERLQSRGRPVVCTEWMRRPISTFATHLPVFQRRRVGCYSWGLVNGRTQTHFPWGSPAGAPEPAEWFHDLLRADGAPYREDEVALVGSLLK